MTRTSSGSLSRPPVPALGTARSAKEIKGKIKEAAGKVLGDAKLESEGKADQAAGKIQSVAGGIKDTLNGK